MSSNDLISMEEQNNKAELIDVLLSLSVQKTSLLHQRKLNIISEADMVNEIAMIESKESNIKQQLVNKLHVTKNGMLRSIKSHGATASYPNGYVYTSLKGGRIVKGKDLETLYDRLYDIYYGSDPAYSIGRIFRFALAEKAETENPDHKTVRRYETDFKRFIDEDFASKTIMLVNEIALKRYTQTLVHRMVISKQAFLSYKGILNLIFRYALVHGLIKTNPVLAINNKVYLKSCNCRKPVSEEKIFSPAEIEALLKEVDRRKGFKKYGGYYSFGYAMRFAALTGVRVGELCALEWNDIDFNAMTIHSHRQQLLSIDDGHVNYYIADHTKNERGISQDGRLFPITDDLYLLLKETLEAQQAAEIQSGFVFCRNNGEPMTIHAYTRFLRKICERLGLSITSNHAFRMALNSNVLIPAGIPETDRARLLGHSVETNLGYYSYASRDYLESTRDKLNSGQNPKGSFLEKKEVFQVIDFTKRKSPQTAWL